MIARLYRSAKVNSVIPDNQHVVKDIVESIRRLVRAEYLDSQKMSKQYGLTGPQSLVLRLLTRKGALSSADLSRQMYVTPSNVTGIIDRLEKKGLVERIRQQGDRRIALISLTRSGQKLGKTIPDPIEKKMTNHLVDLEPEHLHILAKAMNQILDLIDTNGTEEASLD